MFFSVIRKDEQLDDVFDKEGVTGLARISYLRRERKTAGTISRVGELATTTNGVKEFGEYVYTNDNGATSTRVAVFRSSLGNYYEFTVVQLPFTGRKLPPKEEMQRIYSSVLATIDY